MIQLVKEMSRLDGDDCHGEVIEFRGKTYMLLEMVGFNEKQDVTWYYAVRRGETPSPIYLIYQHGGEREFKTLSGASSK